MVRESVVVVMIDDDEEDFIIVKEQLGRGALNDYQLVWISDYDEALERLKKNDGDVFLIDHFLGTKTGLDLLQMGKKAGFRKPSIYLTGTTDPQIDMAALELGASYYINKALVTEDHLLERSIRYVIRTATMYEGLQKVERLQHEKDLAESASQMKSFFLANVSHEIRTPLGAILGFTDLALNESAIESAKQHLRVIKRNAQHLLVLVNDLLDLSKIEAGKYDVQLKPCDWRAVVSEVLSTMRTLADGKDNSLKFVDRADLPKFLITDANLFRQILINLVGNAIKFTRGGTIEIHLGGEKSFILKVIDSGVGITESQQKRLFEPFAQAEPGMYRKFGGTGLGLHLSRRMAHQLNGSLTLHSSAPGVGSTFALTLPGVWVREQSIVGNSECSGKKDLQGLRVLVAEDSQDNQKLIDYILKQAGAVVSLVSNGREAVSSARSGDFDVIVMDIQMPEMDGFEAASLIKSLNLTTPILALSAHAMPEERQRALKSGFVDYLTKPIQVDQLLERLSTFKQKVEKNV